MQGTQILGQRLYSWWTTRILLHNFKGNLLLFYLSNEGFFGIWLMTITTGFGKVKVEMFFYTKC